MTVYSVVYSMFSQLFSFMLPWGITYGSVVVGVLGVPYLVKVLKKVF